MPGPRAGENKENARGPGGPYAAAGAHEIPRAAAQPFVPQGPPAQGGAPLAPPQFGRRHHALAAQGANAPTHELLPGPASKFPPPGAYRERDQRLHGGPANRFAFGSDSLAKLMDANDGGRRPGGHRVAR